MIEEYEYEFTDEDNVLFRCKAESLWTAVQAFNAQKGEVWKVDLEFQDIAVVTWKERKSGRKLTALCFSAHGPVS